MLCKAVNSVCETTTYSQQHVNTLVNILITTYTLAMGCAGIQTCMQCYKHNQWQYYVCKAVTNAKTLRLKQIALFTY